MSCSRMASGNLSVRKNVPVCPLEGGLLIGTSNKGAAPQLFNSPFPHLSLFRAEQRKNKIKNISTFTLDKNGGRNGGAPLRFLPPEKTTSSRLPEVLSTDAARRGAVIISCWLSASSWWPACHRKDPC